MVIYTDGSYRSSRDQMGIGIVWVENDKIIRKYFDTRKGGSNSVAELLAVYIALQSIQQPLESLEIVSDSEYALGMIFKNWKAKKHEKFIDKIRKEVQRVQVLVNSEIAFRHVKGHGTDKLNNLVDSLAANASLYSIYEKD